MNTIPMSRSLVANKLIIDFLFTPDVRFVFKRLISDARI